MHVTKAVRDLAAGLLAREAAKNEVPAGVAAAAESVCSKLCLHLARLVGQEGFAALLKRARTIAGATIPWLSAVDVRPDGSLGGLDAAVSGLDTDEATDGVVTWLAIVVGLLVLFIGKDLTLRILSGIWPDMGLNGTVLDLGGEER